MPASTASRPTAAACMTCATCHVYRRRGLGRRACPRRRADEDAMLEMTAAPRQPTSRLSCQIALDAELDGLTAGLPDTPVLTASARRYRSAPPRQDTAPPCAVRSRIARQALRHPGRRAAHRGHADDLRQPDRPQPDRHDDRRRLRARRAPPPARRSRSSCRWCQLQRGNIIVDFFTASASPRHDRRRSTASARCCSP